jgi:MFS family permease
VTITKEPPGTAGVLTTIKATPVAVRYLLGGVLLNQMGAFVQSFLVLYLVHNGFSAARAGFTLGAYSVGAIVGMLVGGELTQRLGSRRTIASAMAGSAVLVMSLPVLSDPAHYGALLAVVATTGAVTQAYRPAAAALLSDLMPPDLQVMGFSMMRIAMNAGAAIGPLLAAVLILVDWNLLFVVDGLTALGYSALALTLLPRDTGGATAVATPTAPTGTATAQRVGYGAILHDRPFLLYLASMILNAVIYAQFYAVLPLQIEDQGHATALYSAVLALASVILISCELKITTVVRGWVASVAGGVGTTVFGLGFAGYGLAAGSPALILLSTAVFVGGMMVSGPTLWAHPAKAPAAVKGRYLGASHAMFGVGLAVGPTLGVLAWDHLGSGVWAACGLIGFAAAACAVAGLREDWAVTPAGSS